MWAVGSVLLFCLQTKQIVRKKGGKEGRRWRGWRDNEETMEVLLRERIIRGERRDEESKVNNRGSACHRKHTMDRD